MTTRLDLHALPPVEPGSGLRPKILDATGVVERPSELRLKAARPATVELPELPSVAGLVVAAALPAALFPPFRDWARSDRCILIECRVPEQLPATLVQLPADLILVHAPCALPVVRELRIHGHWTPLLYLASDKDREQTPDVHQRELQCALANGATSVVPDWAPSAALVGAARNLLCGSVPRYERLIVTRRVVIRDTMVRVDGRLRTVADREMRLLVYLAKRAGRVISPAEIAAKALGPAVAEATVRKWIERLRRSLGDVNRSIVVSIHGEGYALAR